MVKTMSSIAKHRCAEKREIPQLPYYYIERSGVVWHLVQDSDTYAEWEVVPMHYNKQYRKDYVVLEGVEYFIDYLVARTYGDHTLQHDLATIQDPMILHLDGIRANNNLINLKVVSRSQLMQLEEEAYRGKVCRNNKEREIRRFNKRGPIKISFPRTYTVTLDNFS